MGTGLQLQVRILHGFIFPAVEADQVKARAAKLGFGESLTTEQVDTLHDVIIAETVAKIAAFLQSEEANEISHWAKCWSARASFSCEIGRQVDVTIQKCFHIIPEPPAPSLLDRAWSFIRLS